MRVLAHTLYEDNLSSRYRIYAYLPLWNRLDVQCTPAPATRVAEQQACTRFPRMFHRWRMHLNEILRRRQAIRQSNNYDVAIVQKGFTTIQWRGWIQRQQAQGIPWIYDIDDGIHLAPALTPPRPLHRYWEPDQVHQMVRAATAVVVGNPYLARDFQPLNANVVQIPTSLDLTHYQRTQPLPEADDSVVLGWIGSLSSLPSLVALFPTLAELHRRRPQTRLRVITSPAASLPREPLGGMPLEHIAWSPDTEVDNLQQITIGLMPLQDTPFNRYKCGFKALQYMALGLPAVCSPVGVNREIIQQGHTGLLATDEREWVDALTTLIDDAPLRRQLGAAGRQRVERDFNLEHNARLWLKLFYQLQQNTLPVNHP
jgi:glycosyltransferase involved in cell wall biosynthesis